MTEPPKEPATVKCRHCRERIWPNWTIYGPVWFAVKKHTSGCEEYECPGKPFAMQVYGPHEPTAP